MKRNAAFTLLELLLVAAVVAMLLVGVYGVFYGSVKTRDKAEERVREMRLRERAVNVIREDFRSLYLSGGTFANTLEGGKANPNSSNFSGYLKFSASSGRNTEKDGDVQLVEYYISDNAESSTMEHGPLVRVLTRARDLVPGAQESELKEEELFPDVQQFEVTFYDGANWQENWQYNTGDTLPLAIRLRIRQDEESTPLEIYMVTFAQPL